MVTLFTVRESARYIGCAEQSLYDPRFHRRLGLPAVRVGKQLRFDQADLDRVIRRKKERLLRTAAPVTAT